MEDSSHGGHRDRLRRRFETEGLMNFEPHEVLELLLYYSIPRKDTNPLAHRLIETFGSLDRVLEADIAALTSVEGIGYNTAVLLRLNLELFQYYSRCRYDNRKRIDNCERMGEYMCSRIGMRNREVFAAAAFDAKQREIAFEILSDGTVSQTEVQLRRIAEFAILKKAELLVIAHNHVRGDPTPSQADRDTTREICRSMAKLGIIVADHIITAGENYFSFAMNDIMPI